MAQKAANTGTSSQAEVQLFLAASKAFQGKSKIKLTLPAGNAYKIFKYQPGIVTLKKDFKSGAPDYITLLNLERACFRSLTGDITAENTGKGVFGGNNPKLKRKHLQAFWTQAVSKWHNNLFAVVNCCFFSTDITPTDLAFPLKQENKHVSDGYGSKQEFQKPFQLKTLSFQNKKAAIEGFKDGGQLGAALHSPMGLRNIMGGLDPAANKGPNNFVGRTFIGLASSYPDGKNDIALLFNSAFSSQIAATRTLINDFGCKADQIIMFDGGGSTQLIIKNESCISSSRTIPHALAIISTSRI